MSASISVGRDRISSDDEIDDDDGDDDVVNDRNYSTANKDGVYFKRKYTEFYDPQTSKCNFLSKSSYSDFDCQLDTFNDNNNNGMCEHYGTFHFYK